ncbi:hypothetical protein C834K_0907 [Chlamydia poikilotherma]|uniref:Uncharacterized protein n=2 Tax=Chlamydia poikilotherma TaxID=1967783 RepID=A0A3B0QID0_9CHLA|nr:hypothetical protein C834K_0907 [Chlamydia poikilotherma]
MTTLGGLEVASSCRNSSNSSELIPIISNDHTTFYVGSLIVEPMQLAKPHIGYLVSSP